MSDPLDSAGRARVSTGIEGLDRVLRGGLLAGRTYLVAGAPGTGKTTLALQFLLAGRDEGRGLVYVTLSQSEAELRQIAASHGLDMASVTVIEAFAAEIADLGETQTVLHSSEEELQAMMERLETIVAEHRPSRLVIDSLSEVRLISTSELRFRRRIGALKTYLGENDATTLLLDGLDAPGTTRATELLVQGALHLDWTAPDYGVTYRRVMVSKMRSDDFAEGWHDLAIETGGLAVHPRLASHEATAPLGPDWSLRSNIPALDELMGGGFAGNGTTLILGHTGTGKSVLCTQFLHATARRGIAGAAFLFEEMERDFRARARALSIPVDDAAIHLAHVDPSEASPGQLFERVLAEVDRGARLIVIDSMSGFFHALPEAPAIMAQFVTFLNVLKKRGVATVLTLNLRGLSDTGAVSEIELSLVTDNIVHIRQLEAESRIQRTVAVVKKRYGPHRREIRAFDIEPEGVSVAPIAGGKAPDEARGGA